MSKKLSHKDLEKYQALLLGLRRVLRGDIDRLEDDAFPADSDRPSVDDPADIGSDSFAQEFSLELLQRDGRTLSEIDDALERLDGGAFGVCETCEIWIPRTRLNAVPFARNCIDCQRAAEAG